MLDSMLGPPRPRTLVQPEPFGAVRIETSVRNLSWSSQRRSVTSNCALARTRKPAWRSRDLGRRSSMPDLRMAATGWIGRVACGCIAPNEDLAQSVEKFCLAQGFRNALARGAVVPGANPMRATFEVTLDEWLPARADRPFLFPLNQRNTS